MKPSVLLTRDLSVKDHLKQQITQLLAKMILVADLDGLDGFGGLFHQVLHQRPMSLLGVPGALVAQPRHHVDQSLELG